MRKKFTKKRTAAGGVDLATASSAAPAPAASTASACLPQPAEATGSKGGRLSLVAALLFAMALGIALYLAWVSIAGGAAAGCGPERRCGDVLKSRWSSVFGLPVSLLGAGVYAFLFFSALWLWPVTRAQRRMEGMAWVLVLSGALWFTGVQAFMLKAFCPWCGTAHALASLGVLFLWRARRARPSGLPPDPVGLAFLALPLVAVAGLVLLQTVGPSPERIQQRTAAHSVVVAQGKVSLHHGLITLDPATLPVIGMPGATVTSVALTDFTCPHCRELHRTLTQLASERPGQFNTVLLPGAFEPGAREVHRMMLALWRLDPAQYREVADGLVDGSINPTPQELLDRVQQHFGGKFYERAWAEASWVEGTLRLGDDLLALNSKESQASTLPQLMIGDTVLTGAPHADTVIRLIAQAAEAPSASPPTVVATRAAPASSVASSVPAAAAPGASAPFSVGASGAPVIDFGSTTIELGRVTKGETVAKKIGFTNTGELPLTIKNIKAGCGCTTVQGWQQTVAPGQQGAFEIKLDTTNFAGAVIKTIDVESDATNGTVRLSLKADIWSPVKVSSAAVSFGNVVKGSTVPPKEIEVTVTDQDPLELDGVTSLNPYFNASLKPIEVGRRYVVVVTVPELGDLPQNGELILRTGHAKLKEMKLSAYINPVNPVTVQPSQINVPTAALGAGTKASLMIFMNSPGVKVLEGEDLAFSGGGGVDVRYEKKPSDRWGRITLSFPPGYTPASPTGSLLTFRTNHPSQAEVKIPVHFVPPQAVPDPTGAPR